jgi:hypothetical protein
MNSLQKRVNIDVSLVRPRSPRARLPRLVVVGIVPYDAPVISEVAPKTMIRQSHIREGQPYVEQVRLSSIIQARLLPSIDMKYPSRLRDALIGALSVGVDEVDFILARVPGIAPWEFDNQEVVEMLMPFFNEVPGSMIVFPDLGGPWPRGYLGNTTNDEQRRRLLLAAKIYGSVFSENFQLGFFDLPQLPTRDLEQVFASLRGSDISICAWSGSELNLRRHGWRSSAIFTASYICKRLDMVTQSVVGHQISLGAGRKIVYDRSSLLGAEDAEGLPLIMEENCTILEINRKGDHAEVLSEFTMRRPRYEWSIPTLRTVKAIHQSIRQAADMFVFRSVKKIEAIALETAVSMVLNPFYEMGILVGENGVGKPVVKGEALPDHAIPMLSVDLSAMLQPWCQNINLKIMVKSGMEPQIEEQ